ncbi:hypothetical protein QTP86_025120 [Hemibagrus guttatus]|nr:hypothetical protein QTP86_025120 [Hemibagrus guttatus]
MLSYVQQTTLGEAFRLLGAHIHHHKGHLNTYKWTLFELIPSEGKKYCLVIVDMFSKWVEAFPTSKQDVQ